MPDDSVVRDWISKNVAGGDQLGEAAWHAVSGFTVMWNLFEARGCDTDVTMEKLEALSQRASGVASLPDDLKVALEYWKQRYVGDDGRLTGNFETLYMEKKVQPLVEDVLYARETLVTRQIYVLLLIVRRIRNNLFHGRKSLYDIAGQVENIDMASGALACAFSTLKIAV